MDQITQKEAPYWLMLLQQQLNAGVSIQAIADKIAYSRPAMSRIFSGTYGAKTDKVEKAVLAAFDNFPCPYLSDFHSTEFLITGEMCRNYAHRDCPTSVTHEIRHWQACQGCEKKLAPIPIKIHKSRGHSHAEKAAD